MLGFDLKPRSHHHSDGAWVVRGCHLWGGLLDQRSKRSLPNKAVDVIAGKLSGDRLLSASSTYGSLASAPACPVPLRLRSRLFYDPSPGGVAERLIDLATHPKSMQQDRQLPRYRYRGSLLRVLSPMLAQPQPETS
jgi:hypothetical protein